MNIHTARRTAKKLRATSVTIADDGTGTERKRTTDRMSPAEQRPLADRLVADDRPAADPLPTVEEGSAASKKTKKTKTTRSTQPRTFRAKAEVSLASGHLLDIRGFSTESGDRYIKVRMGKDEAITPYGDWHGQARTALHALVVEGITVVGSTKEVREAVASIGEFPRRSVLTRPGWSRYGFATSAGEVIVRPGRTTPLVTFAKATSNTRRGTLEGWQALATALIPHELASFVLMIPFVAPLLSIIKRFDNFGFELVGQTGRRKATLQMLMASVSGPPSGPPLVDLSGPPRMRDELLAQTMRSGSDSTVVLNDVTMPGTGRGAKRYVADRRAFIAKLSSGQVSQLGRSVESMARFVFVFWLDAPLSLAPEADGVGDVELGERLLTLSFDGREHGVFDACQAGYASHEALTESLRNIAIDHHGHALPAFLRWLVDGYAANGDGLKATIEKYVGLFVKRSGIDQTRGHDLRIAEAFGLVAVAGMLAKRAGVLPEGFQCRAPALAALARSRELMRQLERFEDRLRALMHSGNVINLDDRSIADLPSATVTSCHAFLKTGRGCVRLLIIPKTSLPILFPDWSQLRRLPEVEARLHRYATRSSIERPVGPNGAKVASYAFRVNDLEA